MRVPPRPSGPAMDSSFGNEVTDQPEPIRLLVLARHPLGIDGFGLEAGAGIEIVGLIRRPGALEEEFAELDPDVVLVDTGFPEAESLDALRGVTEAMTTVKCLALTPDPPPHADVARAIEAGASGFVDVDAHPDEFASAIRSVRDGGLWLPADQTEAVLRDVAADLDVSKADRRSRLTAIVLGAIPLAGILAAVLSLLWRRYLGHIGVRPIDLAVDPSTRVVDAVASMLFVVGVFGPFLFLGTWLALIAARSHDGSALSWISSRPRLARALLFVVVLVAVALMVWRLDLILILIIGPAILLAILAVTLDITAELPPFLRLTGLKPRRLLAAGLAIVLAFLAILGSEALVRGPSFGPRGAEGILLHRVIGFRTQPVLATNVGGDREPREVLYLGGNADLYVFVDPCDNDEVEYVSVSAYRLKVIDEVTCEADPD